MKKYAELILAKYNYNPQTCYMSYNYYSNNSFTDTHVYMYLYVSFLAKKKSFSCANCTTRYIRETFPAFQNKTVRE